MATEREWLISKGLAKPGRGRFSAIAKEALRRAKEDDGVVFDSPEKAKSDAKVASPAKKSEPLSASPVSTEPKEVHREEEVMWGIDENKIVIAFEECTCGSTIKTCACVNGPQLPKWIGGGTGLLVKPDSSKVA